MSLFRDLDNAGFDDLATKFFGERPQTKDVDPLYAYYYEEVAYLIAEYDEGYDFLVKAIPKSDQERLRAVIAALSVARGSRDEVIAMLDGFLREARPSIVSQAILSLGRMNASGCTEHVLRLRASEHAEVRSAVLGFLAATQWGDVEKALVEALRDPSADVRESAADILWTVGTPESLPALRAVADDPDERVRAAVAAAIESLEEEAGSPAKP